MIFYLVIKKYWFFEYEFLHNLKMSKCKRCGNKSIVVDGIEHCVCQRHATNMCIDNMNGGKFMGDQETTDKWFPILFHEHYLVVKYAFLEYTGRDSPMYERRRGPTQEIACYLPKLIKKEDMSPMHTVKNTDLLMSILFPERKNIEILEAKVFVNTYLNEM